MPIIGNEDGSKNAITRTVKSTLRFGSEMAMIALSPAAKALSRRGDNLYCSQFDVRAGVRKPPFLNILIDYRKSALKLPGYRQWLMATPHRTCHAEFADSFKYRHYAADQPT